MALKENKLFSPGSIKNQPEYSNKAVSVDETVEQGKIWPDMLDMKC